MRILFTLYLSLFLTVALYSQESDLLSTVERHIYLSGGFQVGIPVQVFAREGQEVAGGLAGMFLMQIGERPLLVGLEVASLRFDSERIRFEDNFNGFIEEFRQSTKNNAVLLHAVVRFQPQTARRFRPYLDGMLGAKDLFTRTTLENLDTEDSSSNTDRADWTLSYGLAAGLQLALFRNPALTIDLRCMYTTGPNATFLVRQPGIEGPFNDPRDAFWEKNAPPTMIIPQLGVSIDLTWTEKWMEGEWEE